MGPDSPNVLTTCGYGLSFRKSDAIRLSNHRSEYGRDPIATLSMCLRSWFSSRLATGFA